ncbi:MAG: hypothetical protein K2X69_10355, partial [Silvanigrellaceae bacterium]|nr:hypothetical protein [Silvanigrellaceae bacterium]
YFTVAAIAHTTEKAPTYQKMLALANSLNLRPAQRALLELKICRQHSQNLTECSVGSNISKNRLFQMPKILFKQPCDVLVFLFF